MQKLFALTPYLAPVLMILLSIPLIAKRVPPNGVYGYRTASTLASPERWFAANYNVGLASLVASLLGVVAVYLILGNYAADRHQAVFVATLVGVAFVLVGTLAGALLPTA